VRALAEPGAFTESVVEEAALAWRGGVGWQVKNGAEIAPGEPGGERDDNGQVVPPGGDPAGPVGAYAFSYDRRSKGD
jgi:hypothetical protein